MLRYWLLSGVAAQRVWIDCMLAYMRPQQTGIEDVCPEANGKVLDHDDCGPEQLSLI